MTTAERLEYLRGEIRAERISYGELAELQTLAPHIDPGDVELLEAAGVPEYPIYPDGADRSKAHPPLAPTWCPECSGPVVVTPDDSGGVTVDFWCDNPRCTSGKHDD